MSSYDEAFKVSQRQFIDKLPERFARLRQNYNMLDDAGWQPDLARQLHHQLHSLTGSAGTFGLQSLCAATRQLETRLKAIIAAAQAPDTEKWQIIGTELSRLEHIASSWFDSAAVHMLPPTEIHAPSKSPLIYLVEDDTIYAARLAQSLQRDGFRVQMFPRLADFRAAWQQGPKPDALVLDIVFPEGDTAGLELLTELKAAKESCPPVVISSFRDDLPSRLAAYRAGASRYLSKPLKDKKLSDILDCLTGRLPDNPYRVVLVDDDPLLLQAQSAVLQQAGMLVQALTKPEKTLQLLDSFNPDVLVLDVFMPEIRGPELAAIVREREAYLQLPILFLSAETDLSQQLLALNLGGDDFLVKPVQPQHLVSAIVARARRKRQTEALNLRLQHTLYEREREHQALNLHALVSVADIAGRITYVNDLFCQTSGYSQQELLGKNHRIVKSAEHPAEFYQQLWSTISSGLVWHGEICNRRKGGSLYWVMSTITPLIGDNGKPYQYISVRTDITAQKRVEQAERTQNAIRIVLAEAAQLLLSADYQQLDDIITQVLGLAGNCLAVERAYLFQISADGRYFSNSHEWCASGIAPQQVNLQQLAVETCAWWWAQMEQGAMIKISDVADLPPEAAAEQAILESQDIRATCAFPLRRAGKTWGFLGFDQVTWPRVWEGDALYMLGLLVNQIGSALHRSQSEQSKARSIAKLNATLESTKDGILAIDETGKILFLNRQFREMWRLPSEQLNEASNETLLEHALTQLVDPKDFLLKVRALYRSGEESNDLISLKDGRIFERHSKPLFGHGENASRVWSFHDITERRRAEEAADAAKERLRRGQLYANIGTWEWNIATGNLFWSERIAPLFGYPTGDLETSYDNFLAAIHPDDRQAVIAAADACIERDEPYNMEHRVVWPDGNVRWLMERGAVRRDAKGKALLMTGVVQDVTDRKRAEIELIEAREQAEQANRAKSEFLSSMSHELRTPMNAILGFGQLMQYDDTLPEEHKDSVHEILKAGGHLLDLINEVLDLAKVESGTLNLSLEPVALCPMVQECKALIAGMAERRNISLYLECADDIMMRADRTRLKQVLLNLLSNAVKYNRDAGSVKLELQYPGQQYLRILVKDTGPGIAADKLQGLFQPFNRLGAENSEIEGTGIGLTITRHIVEMMGGSIGVDSEPGVGSSFWIELPLEQQTNPADGKKNAELEANSYECCGKACQDVAHRVLYIEDNPANIKLVTQILATVPHLSLFTAPTPALGLELAVSRKPALILLDINLPGMDGYQVLKVLQAEPGLQHIPVIAITANAMASDIQRGKAAGFAEYLTKPLNIDRFLKSVERYIRGDAK